MGCAIDYIADNGASRRFCARASAVQHNVLYAVARKIYGVIAVVYACKRVFSFYKRGVNAHLYSLCGILAYRKQLQHISELLTVSYIER